MNITTWCGHWKFRFLALSTTNLEEEQKCLLYDWAFAAVYSDELLTDFLYS